MPGAAARRTTAVSLPNLVDSRGAHARDREAMHCPGGDGRERLRPLAGPQITSTRNTFRTTSCGCGRGRAASSAVRWRACAASAATAPGALDVRVRRRTGRSVSVLFLLLVLAVTGCCSPSLATPLTSWPAALRRIVSNRIPPLALPRLRQAGWNAWNGWSADALLDRLTRLGSLLTGPTGSAEGSSGKVLNFFPVPVSDECLSSDGRRTGVCLNTYECRIQNGKSYGPCALGFGVCCVFTASCGDVIENNVTYFVNPKFPAITRDSSTCELLVKKIAPDVSQLRLDFIHFNMGQPNRRTGVCESDTFLIAADTTREFSVCGHNSGQHFYFDVEDMNDPITITMNMSREHTARLWEIKVTQIEFKQRAPAGCLQYHRGESGVIQTMNFAENGRHLANQDYTICMRQEEGMCSIVYEPCDENSFKIGPASQQLDVAGSGDGPVGEAREQCNDKIVMPCDSEEFLAAEGFSPSGLCDLLHCGNSFCSPGEPTCRIESSTTPFNIRVMFGPAVREESPEDNLGMCLKYEQQSCVSR